MKGWFSLKLFLEVLNGEDKGKKFRINEGFRIGRSRSECQVFINDPKISAVHCKVSKNPQGQLFLVDQNSANGIKINKLRTLSVLLLPGIVFQLGRTLFRVISSASITKDSAAIKQSWVEEFKNVLNALQEQPNSSNDLRPFEPAIKLLFLRGPHTTDEIILGYGPRTLGSESSDLLVLDAKVPAIAFELIPDRGGVRFQTAHPDLVKLNNQNISNDFISNKDEIRTGDSLIRVEYV